MYTNALYEIPQQTFSPADSSGKTSLPLPRRMYAVLRYFLAPGARARAAGFLSSRARALFAVI